MEFEFLMVIKMPCLKLKFPKKEGFKAKSNLCLLAKSATQG